LDLRERAPHPAAGGGEGRIRLAQRALWISYRTSVALAPATTGERKDQINASEK
jgi:hypothetical protein